MKLDAIAKLCAKTKSVLILNVEYGQWLGTGVGPGMALYRVAADMPRITEGNVLALLGVAEETRGSYTVAEDWPEAYGLPEALFADDFAEEPLQRTDVTAIAYQGTVLDPARTTHGLEYFAPDCLKPIKEKMSHLTERRANGQTVLAAMGGAFVQGIIWPLRFDRSLFHDVLKQMLDEDLAALNAHAHGGDVETDPETGEIV